MKALPDGDDYTTTTFREIDGARWLIVGHWTNADGRLEPLGIEVWSRPPPEPFGGGAGAKDWQPSPVTSTVLRRLNIGQALDDARRSAHSTAAFIVKTPEEWQSKTVAAAEVIHRATAGRPPKYDHAHFEKVAEVYRRAYAANKTPTRAVARQYDVTDSTARKWVERCRRDGLLPPTRPGVALADAPSPTKRGKR